MLSADSCIRLQAQEFIAKQRHTIAYKYYKGHKSLLNL